MTEPVQGVIRSGGVERRSTSQEREQNRERLRRLMRADRGHDEQCVEDDSVELSEEARRRADGTWRKNILEHLEDTA